MASERKSKGNMPTSRSLIYDTLIDLWYFCWCYFLFTKVIEPLIFFWNMYMYIYHETCTLYIKTFKWRAEKHSLWAGGIHRHVVFLYRWLLDLVSLYLYYWERWLPYLACPMYWLSCFLIWTSTQDMNILCRHCIYSKCFHSIISI